MKRQVIMAACIGVAMIAPAAAQTDDASAANSDRSITNLDTPDRAALTHFTQAHNKVDPHEPVPVAMMGQIAHAARDTGGKHAAAYFASNPRSISASSKGDTALDHVRRFQANNAMIAPANPTSNATAHR